MSGLVNVIFDFNQYGANLGLFFDYKIAVVHSAHTGPNRYTIIRTKQDAMNMFPSPSLFENSIIALAGEFPIYVYSSINNIREEDGIFVFMYHRGNGIGYITDIENITALLSAINIMVLAPVDDLLLCDSTLYHIGIRRFVGLVYGHTRGNYFLAAEYVRAIGMMIKEGKFFCGVRKRINNIVEGINQNVRNILLLNNINFPNGKTIFSIKTLDGLYYHHVLVNMWIRKYVKKILLSFKGYPNGPNVWREAQSQLNAFGSFLAGMPCGDINFAAKVDEENNIESSDTLNAEIQYLGAATDDIRAIERVTITIKL